MSSIKHEIISGVFWIALAKYSGLFISLGVTAILARNISPEAFGTIAVATVIMAFLDIFIDMGIGTAVIQFKGLTKEQINSLFMMGCFTGIILSMSMYVAAPFIASFYADNTLKTICRLLCICIMFNAMNIVPNGLMMKYKRFRTVALRTLFFQITCGLLAVMAAINGYGVYALIITPILSSIGVFVVNFYNYPQKITFNLSFDVVKKIWKYSSFQFCFSFTNYFSRNIDKLIIGKYFSMSDLGYYDKSYRLMQLPLQNVTFVISPVLHPILSSLQDDKIQLSDKNIKLSKVLSNLSFPIGILLFFCAKEIIEIIFGPEWKPSIPVFKILALSLPLQMILSTSGSLFQAAGKTNHLFFSGLINTFTTVFGFLISAIFFKTITSMAWAWDITLVLNFFNTYYIMNHITFGTSFRKFSYSLIPQLINTLIVSIATFFLLKLFIINNIFISLVLKTLIIGGLTIGMAYLLGQYNALSLIRNRWKNLLARKR